MEMGGRRRLQPATRGGTVRVIDPEHLAALALQAGGLNFDILAGIALTPGTVVAATARNMTTNETSEFSPCATVTAGAPDPDALEPAPEEADDPDAEENRPSALSEPAARVRDEPLLVALRLE
jgi:hypothetical protein